MSGIATLRDLPHHPSSDELEGGARRDLDRIHAPHSRVDNVPFVVRHDPVYEAIKRTIDVVLSVAIGAVFLLALPVIAMVIKLDSPGPIFYRQTRVGKDGKLFTIWKLRSMRSDAEKDGAVWATANDDRVTRVGRFMRKTRIDELPQMWNVLRGEMSMVGPRPERPEFVAILESQIPNYLERHQVKPGVTGWAQVCYHYTDSVEETRQKLDYDLQYIDNRNLRLDIAILLRTFRVVVSRNGW